VAATAVSGITGSRIERLALTAATEHSERLFPLKSDWAKTMPPRTRRTGFAGSHGWISSGDYAEASRAMAPARAGKLFATTDWNAAAIGLLATNHFERSGPRPMRHRSGGHRFLPVTGGAFIDPRARLEPPGYATLARGPNKNISEPALP
jgi:hypothetical protein